MSKTTKVTFTGDGSDAQSVHYHGHEFVKGQAVDVSSDKKDALEAMEAHPHFHVAGGEKSEEFETDDEQETFALRRLLDERGIRYRSNASIQALRKLAAEGGDVKAATTVEGSPHPQLATHAPAATDPTPVRIDAYTGKTDPAVDPAKGKAQK